jgi:hypothetical protein
LRVRAHDISEEALTRKKKRQTVKQAHEGSRLIARRLPLLVVAIKV